MQRLFIGIDFNEKDKAFFALAQDVLRKYCDRGRYTQPENFHLTLKFLGLVPEAEISKLIEIINNLEVPDLILVTEHLGFFSKKRGYIAYLGFRPHQELAQLAQDLNGFLEAAGFGEPEEHLFTPHITLCRQANFLCPLVDLSKGLNLERELAVDNITLYESINIDGVLKYRPLYVRKVR